MDTMADERQLPCSIWGSTLDSLDCIVEECLLPDMIVGEWIIFHNMGDYSMVSATTFNGTPKPKRYYRLSTPEWYLCI